jgi:signal transduction histidine kinase
MGGISLNVVSALSFVDNQGQHANKKASLFNAWLRCVKLGAPAFGLSEPPSSFAEEAEELQRQHHHLITTSSPYLDIMEQLAQDWPACAVVLTNNAGRVLSVRINPEAASGQLLLFLQPGSSLAEEAMGNNGAGTALHSGQLSVFNGFEHYNQSYLDWSTAGVPIITPSGETVGALGVFVSQGEGMVEEAARFLEAIAATLGRTFNRIEPDCSAAPVNGCQNSAVRQPDSLTSDESLYQYDHLSLALKIMGGFAHEVRNPLTIIRGFAQLLLEGTSHPDQTRRYLSLILDEVDRVNDQIKGFISLSSSDESNDQTVDIDSVLKDVNLLMDGYVFLKGINLVVETEPEVGAVKGNPQQLRQVMINLTKNALDATPAGGTVTVRAAGNDEQVRIEVADSGAGIPEELMPQIFDLFFTTRDGVGLGLAISRDVIHRHDGTITVDSSLTEGTRVTVIIPRSPRVLKA